MSVLYSDAHAHLAESLLLPMYVNPPSSEDLAQVGNHCDPETEEAS